MVWYGIVWYGMIKIGSNTKILVEANGENQ